MRSVLLLKNFGKALLKPNPPRFSLDTNCPEEHRNLKLPNVTCHWRGFDGSAFSFERSEYITKIDICNETCTDALITSVYFMFSFNCGDCSDACRDAFVGSGTVEVNHTTMVQTQVDFHRRVETYS